MLIFSFPTIYLGIRRIYYPDHLSHLLHQNLHHPLLLYETHQPSIQGGNEATTQPERDIELSNIEANTTVPSGDPGIPRNQHIPQPMEKSFQVFWELIIYFSIAILIATSATLVRERDKPSLHTTTFCSLGFAVIFVIVCLIPYVLDHPERGSGKHFTQFEIRLAPLPSVVIFSNPDVVFVPLFFGPLFLFVLISMTVLMRIGTPSSSYLRAFKAAAGAACFVLMWMSLGGMAYIRLQLGETGNNDHFAHDEMGFGQILAVVAWLPTFCEF